VKTSTREQDGILHHTATQQVADQNYIEDGIQLLELASEAHQLFLEQEPEEKRRLLGFLVAIDPLAGQNGELAPLVDALRTFLLARAPQTLDILREPRRAKRPRREPRTRESPAQLNGRLASLVRRTGHYLKLQIELAKGVLDLIKRHRERLEPRPGNRQSHVVLPQPDS
jgi:hypothetical protein